jgi:hypothetical protein
VVDVSNTIFATTAALVPCDPSGSVLVVDPWRGRVDGVAGDRSAMAPTAQHRTTGVSPQPLSNSIVDRGTAPAKGAPAYAAKQAAPPRGTSR